MVDDSQPSLPARTGAVVIGGGIIGAVTALELAERGVSVVLCEKGAIAAEQSGRSLGWCRQMGREPREASLAALSLKLWRQLDQRVRQDTGFRQCGIMTLCDTDAELAAQERWLSRGGKTDEGPYMISADEVAHRVPGSARPWKGALFAPADGCAEPGMATAAIIAAAIRAGARIFTRCAVRGLDITAGRIAGVVTERGRIACDTVVLAGGAWSRHFCESLGLSLPQLLSFESIMRTSPVNAGFEHATSGGIVALRKRLDGGFNVAHERHSTAEILPASFRFLREFLPLIRAERRRIKFKIGKRFIDEMTFPRHWPLDQASPFERFRTMEAKPNPTVMKQAFSALSERYPVFKGATAIQMWAGVIDVTPDTVPVISPVARVPGFYLATGFSGHGFGVAPGAGKLIADLVLNERPCVDPEPFSYARFQRPGSTSHHS